MVLALLLGAFGAACYSRPLDPSDSPPVPRPPRPVEPSQPRPEPLPAELGPPRPVAGQGPLVRIALRVADAKEPLGATGAWRLLDPRGGVLVRAAAHETWTLQRDGARLRAMRGDGTTTAWVDGPLSVYADDAGAFVRVAGKPYRGALDLVPTDSGILAVNVLAMEDYLRGVVPLEIGARTERERAAVEAQAVAARSYTVTRVLLARAGNGRSGQFDLVASVADQVYGGRDAELPLADEAVRATANLVLLYDGRVVTAPFSSTCGGETAAAEEVWRSDGEPHLQRVSDRIPGSDRYYCDIAPRFAWTRVLTGSELDGAIRRYLGAYAGNLPADGPGRVRDLTVDGRTPSGRVANLAIETEKGTFRVRGNDARSVLRAPGGELLNSAYFSVTTESSAGRLTRAVIRGNGYGHGVGMCQWGAIGRARAGQDVRTILRTYYRGTTVGPIPAGLLTP
jgi:stage II sporulation protein D